ncbi:MAG: phage integrase N-terminal SAM-like domain-containing protein, partial [Spirochaetia bacterium]
MKFQGTDSTTGSLEEQLKPLEQFLKRRDYSRSTVKTYLRELTLFFKRTNLAPDKVRPEDINLYLEKLRAL